MTCINTHKPKTILEVIHHSLVVAKIFAPNKSFVKSQDNGDKNFKDCTNKDAKAIGNKDQRATNGKKKEAKEYKGQNKLSPMELEKYRKENCCFNVESTGIATAIAQRRHKGHHKHRTFYPLIMMSQCKVHPNCCIHGGECGIKALSCSWILALPIILSPLNLHRG